MVTIFGTFFDHREEISSVRLLVLAVGVASISVSPVIASETIDGSKIW